MRGLPIALPLGVLESKLTFGRVVPGLAVQFEQSLVCDLSPDLRPGLFAKHKAVWVQYNVEVHIWRIQRESA